MGVLTGYEILELWQHENKSYKWKTQSINCRENKLGSCELMLTETLKDGKKKTTKSDRKNRTCKQHNPLRMITHLATPNNT